jgi:thiol-disulfide isomerase/thioredoxin
VVVNVWASWCPPCIKEQPDLNAAAAALGDDVQFIGLNIRDASQDDAAAYVRDLDVPYSSIYSADGSALLPFAGTLTPRSIPSTVVLDAEGRVAASVNGRIPTTQTLVSLVEAVRDE